MTPEEAGAFAKEWIDAWNSHDLERILSHYGAGVEFRSPFIVHVLNEPSGTIRGREALRDYLARGLAAFPDLKFELMRALPGIRSVVLLYRSVRGLLAAEVMDLDDSGKVVRVAAHYTEER